MITEIFYMRSRFQVGTKNSSRFINSFLNAILLTKLTQLKTIMGLGYRLFYSSCSAFFHFDDATIVFFLTSMVNWIAGLHKLFTYIRYLLQQICSYETNNICQFLLICFSIFIDAQCSCSLRRFRLLGLVKDTVSLTVSFKNKRKYLCNCLTHQWKEATVGPLITRYHLDHCYCFYMS